MKRIVLVITIILTFNGLSLAQGIEPDSLLSINDTYWLNLKGSMPGVSGVGFMANDVFLCYDDITTCYSPIDSYYDEYPLFSYYDYPSFKYYWGPNTSGFLFPLLGIGIARWDYLSIEGWGVLIRVESDWTIPEGWTILADL